MRPSEFRRWARGPLVRVLRDRSFQSRPWLSSILVVCGVGLLYFFASEFADEAKSHDTNVLLHMIRHPLLFGIVAFVIVLFSLPAYLAIKYWWTWGSRLEIDPSSRRLMRVDYRCLDGDGLLERSCQREPFVLSFDQIEHLVVKTFKFTRLAHYRGGRTEIVAHTATAIVAMPSGIILHQDASQSLARLACKRIAKTLGVDYRVDHTVPFRQLPETPGATDDSHPPKASTGQRLAIVWVGAWAAFFLFCTMVHARISWEIARNDPTLSAPMMDLDVVVIGVLALLLSAGLVAVCFARITRSVFLFYIPLVPLGMVIVGSVAAPALGQSVSLAERMLGRPAPQEGAFTSMKERAR